MRVDDSIPTEMEMRLARSLGPFPMRDSRIDALFNLMQERDDLIQLMMDWIEANPGETTHHLLLKAADIQQRDAGFR